MESTKKPSKTQPQDGVPVEAAMLCKTEAKKRLKVRETGSGSDESNKIFKTKKGTCRGSSGIYEKAYRTHSTKDHEDHIASKGYNSSSHKNLVHKFIPMPQARM